MATNSDTWLAWPDGYSLQFARDPAAPYALLPGAASPHPLRIPGEPAGFYRLYAEVRGVLAIQVAPPGGPEVRFGGTPGWTYVLQGSSDLREWSPLLTNTASFQFSDLAVWITVHLFALVAMTLPLWLTCHRPRSCSTT